MPEITAPPQAGMQSHMMSAGRDQIYGGQNAAGTQVISPSTFFIFFITLKPRVE